MGLETGSYISDLNSAWPLGTDQKSTADDHTRLIKAILKGTFPNVNGAVNPTPTEFNTLAGIMATTAELNQLHGLTLHKTLAAYKAALTARTSVTVMANDPDLVLAIPGAGIWQFDLVAYFYGTGGVGQGYNYQMNFSGTYTAGASYWDGGPGSLAAIQATQTAGPVGVANLSGTTAPGVAVSGSGLLVATGAGNLGFTWSQNSSSSNATNCSAGSFLKAQQIA